MVGEVVLITGCSRGIGLGLVKYFATAGYKVVATCRDPKKAEELTSLLSSLGQQPALSLDTTDPASLLKAVNHVWTKYGRVDILLNNAGVATKNHPHDPPEFLDVEEMVKVYQTNVGGTCATTQVIHKQLLWHSKTSLTLCDKGLFATFEKIWKSKSPGHFFISRKYIQEFTIRV